MCTMTCLCFIALEELSLLVKNFPEFKQKDTIIAAFGPTTAKAIVDNNMRLDLHAPQPNAPSMTGAIENFVKKFKEVESNSRLVWPVILSVPYASLRSQLHSI